jgi:hypothetical protein
MTTRLDAFERRFSIPEERMWAMLTAVGLIAERTRSPPGTPSR